MLIELVGVPSPVCSKDLVSCSYLGWSWNSMCRLKKLRMIIKVLIIDILKWFLISSPLPHFGCFDNLLGKVR